MRTYLRKIYPEFTKIIDKIGIRSQIRNLYFKFRHLTPWHFKNYLKMSNFLSQFIKKGDLCYDIGANIGYFTKVFLLLGARVISIEPQENNIQRLYDVFNKNKKVIIIPKAVGEKIGSAEMTIL